jgi:hypothetical protein
MNAGMTQMNEDLAMVVPGIRIDPQIGQIGSAFICDKKLSWFIQLSAGNMS